MIHFVSILPKSAELCVPLEIEFAHLNGNRSECQEQFEARSAKSLCTELGIYFFSEENKF